MTGVKLGAREGTLGLPPSEVKQDERQLVHDFKPTPNSRELGIPDPPASSLDGFDHDRCPDGCCVVDPHYRNQDRWSMYHSPCGLNWTRTTRQGLEYDEARGVPTKYKTGSATRFVSVPSRRFSSQYERIFGHK